MNNRRPLDWVGRLGRTLAVLRSESHGASAIEFALLAPILVLTLAATVDFGLVVHIRLTLNQAVSAAANYAMVNAANVSSNAEALASSLGAIVPKGTDAAIVVNNGPTFSRVAGAVTVSGTQAAAGACYCPTRNGATISWGSEVSCGATCVAGGSAGQFVAVTASETYAPMFNGWGIVEDGAISVRSIVRVK